MPVFNVTVLMAGHGDCLWIEYGDSTSISRILIDGGTAGTFNRLEPLLESVRTIETPSHELMVVTHVDTDHIAGCLPVLAHSTLSKQFKEVWFNGRHHLQADDRFEILGAVQGELLSDSIDSNKIPWNTSFKNKSVSLTPEGQPPRIVLSGGAILTLLSPGRKQLETMARAWDDEIRKAGLKKGTKAEPVEPLKGFERLGALDVDVLASGEFDEDNSPANGSSIAFLMEYGGKRALFAGDAHPTVLLQSLRQLDGGKKIPLDLFKLPHHGSKYNISAELLAMAPSTKYIFSTNGTYFKHPDKEAVAKVIKYGRKGAQLIFNCQTERNDMWDSKGLMDKWGYSVLYGDNEGGIRLPLI